MPAPRECLRLARRSLVAGAGSLLAAPSIVRAQSQNGVALVIGNSKYKWEASLPNVKRDAPDVAKRFQVLGLKTELLQDAGQDAMRAAIDKFATAARGVNLAAFYFAGHGASWDANTYLVPQDADLSNTSIVQSLLPVAAVSSAMKEAAHRLLVFDNCRNNPADGWRQREAVISSSMSNAELAAAALHGPNTLVMFSTAPGRVAVDGPAGENSPFAAMFLRQLSEQAVDLQALPTKLRRALLVTTEGRQVLWDQSTYDQPFVVGNASARPSANSRGAEPASSSQLVELDNAYAFAREKGLLLPPGLVGSFKTTIKVTVGSQLAAVTGTSLEPLILIVLSVSGGNSAEIVFATKDWFRGTGGIRGSVWRYSTATLSGPKLEFGFARRQGGGGNEQEYTQSFKWSDANSGAFSGQTNNTITNFSSFARLDG